MQVTGRASKQSGSWLLVAADGKRYSLTGEELPLRCEGLTLSLAGVVEDSFGLGSIHDQAVLQVQRWRVV